MNLNLMPEQPDSYEPTEADIDMVIEEATGKPVKPANLAAGIASMRQRIAQLEAEKAKLLAALSLAHRTGEGGRRPGEGQDSDDSLKDHLASINKDLAIARERLAHYEAQLGMQN